MKSAVNLIPMAGAGARFVREGFCDPKPLIDLYGKPMVIRATKCLPGSGEWIFVCRKEHLDNYPLEEILKKAYPACTILSIDHLSEGQASTCFMAEKYMDLDNPLLISACDNGIVYNKLKLDTMMRDKALDALIFTFRRNAIVARNPKMYGWVKVDHRQRVEQVSVKVPISAEPIRDHAAVGTFWFRKGEYFIHAAKEMVANNTRINNEFYVDECLNNVVARGLNVKVFEVDKYICWGTPDELRTFNYWYEYFKVHKFY